MVEPGLCPWRGLNVLPPSAENSCANCDNMAVARRHAFSSAEPASLCWMDSYQELLYLSEVREKSASFGSRNTGYDPADSRASFWTNQLAGFAL